MSRSLCSVRIRTVIAAAFTSTLLAALPITTAAQEAAATKPAARATGMLEEVVVNARKYEESLQDTPVAVTAMTGDDLRDRGIVTIEDLENSVPSLEINFHQFYIRGIGERTGFVRVDPTVGMYLDDLFIPRSDGMILDTIDIRSVQVLRGPQGTLFGKNTTGGAIVMSLEKPHTDHREGYIEAELGNLGAKSVRAGINLPISDQFATRIALSSRYRKPYFDEQVGEDTASINRQSLALQTRWEASSDLSLDTLLFYGHTDERYAGSNCRVSKDDSLFLDGLYVAWPGDTDPNQLTAFRENCEANSVDRIGEWNSRMGEESMLDRVVDAVMIGATLEWQVLDNHMLKAVFGARDSNKGPLINSDQDGGEADFQEAFNPRGTDARYGSLELQMIGSFLDQRLRYSGGVFYMQEHNYEPFLLLTGIAGLDADTAAQFLSGNAPSRPAPGGTVPLVGVLNTNINLSVFDLRTKTFATFFQGSYDVTENIELTMGLRWTQETRESDLEVYQSDSDAITAKIAEHPCFEPANSGPFPDPTSPFTRRNTLNPSNCPWALDPVGIAAAMFPDADKDGIPDFPMLSDPSVSDKRKGTFRKLTPMMSLSYSFPETSFDGALDFLSSAMVYVTYSEGFKSGFFEPRVTDGLQLVKPEEVDNLEVGFKLEAFDNSLRLNGAIYSMDFVNMQLINASSDSQGNLAVVFQNAGASRIIGSELELLWMPLPGAMINFSLSANDYEFQEFQDRDFLQAVLGNEVPIDRSDEAFPIAPDYSASFGAQFTIPTAIGLITPRLDVSYKSDIYIGLDDGSWDAYERDVELAGQPAYTLVDFRLTWSNEDGSSSLAAYVNNATNVAYRNGAASVGDSIGVFFESYDAPRTFGLQYRRIY